jgi:predicted DNA-binding transcriptional regulator AlpA
LPLKGRTSMCAKKTSQTNGDLFDIAEGRQGVSLGPQPVCSQTDTELECQAFSSTRPANMSNGGPFPEKETDGAAKTHEVGTKKKSLPVQSSIQRKKSNGGPKPSRVSHRFLQNTEAIPARIERYLSVRDVASRYGVGRSTIWRWSSEDGTFPNPIHLSTGITRWLETELLAFEAGRKSVK